MPVIITPENRWLLIVQAGLEAALLKVDAMLADAGRPAPIPSQSDDPQPVNPAEKPPVASHPLMPGAVVSHQSPAVDIKPSQDDDPKPANPPPPDKDFAAVCYLPVAASPDPKPLNPVLGPAFGRHQKTPERVELLRKLWWDTATPVEDILRQLNATSGAPIKSTKLVGIYVIQWGIAKTGSVASRGAGPVAQQSVIGAPPTPTSTRELIAELEETAEADDDDDGPDPLAIYRRPPPPPPAPPRFEEISVRRRDIAAWAAQISLTFNGHNLDQINRARRMRDLPLYAPPTED